MSSEKVGTRVAVLISTNIDFAAVVQTLAAMRVILVPLNIRLTPTEIKWHIEFSKCDVLLYSEELKSLASLIDTHIPMHNVDEMVTVDYLVSLDGKLPHGYIAVRVGRKSPDLSATQAIVFTSGTSGKPKGVEITFGNHFYSAMASAYRLGLNPNDRWLSVLPLYHVGGLAVIFRSTLYGITTVLHDRFDIDRIQYSFDYHGITMISLVPTMLYRMIEAGVRWPDSLRLILLGGAAAPPELLQRAFDMGLPIAPTYGLTEAASQVATMRPEDAWKKPGSVGKPLMFTSVRIADENGGSVPAGEYGEVLVGGPTVMKGYYKNDDANAKTLFNGELRTGDIGYLDEDGDLWLVQRRSDLIVSGGENVYPAEVENVLRGHPAVREAVVVGVNHPEWGQQVAAAIQLADGATLTEQELTDYSREHLAGYKQPRRILFVEAFPQTASGKIQRGEVSKLFDDTN
ncbi:MAG: o-succinylbenzoate--CoA ligase [Chloroflexota bacterium]